MSAKGPVNMQEMIVCFLDILGFENLSLSKPDGDKKAEKAARDFKEILGYEVLKTKNGDLEIDEVERISKYIQTPRIAGISDSIFVTLPLEPLASARFDLEFLIKGLGSTLLGCLREEIPLRGSISIGRAIQNEADSTGIISGVHLVGVPVTQAARFEQQQEWVGISFVPDIHGNEPDVLLHLIDKKAVIEWGVPTESGLQKTWVVAWPEQKLDEAIGLLEGQYEEYLKTNRRVAAKYYSTIIFLKHQRNGTECAQANRVAMESD